MANASHGILVLSLVAAACSNGAQEKSKAPAPAIDGTGSDALTSGTGAEAAGKQASDAGDKVDEGAAALPKTPAGSATALSASEDSLIAKDGQTVEAGVIYVRLGHLAGDDTSAAALDVYRFGVTKALNTVSVKPTIATMEALDAGKSVYRVKLADFSLKAADWQLIKSAPGADTGLKTAGKATIADGDWLVYALTRPEIYDKIMRIPNFVNDGNFPVGELEKQLGADRSKSVYMTVHNSEVTFDTRILERIPVSLPGMTDGYYWRSYDFLASADPVSKAQGLADPTSLHLAAASAGNLVAGEMFFSLPNGLQAYMLSGFQRQHRLDAQAVVATDHSRPQDGLTRCVGGVAKCGYVINGESCHTCHAQGMKMPKAIDSVKGATQEQALALLNKDLARFNKAVDAMGFPEVSIEPIKATLRRYRELRKVADVRAQGSEVNPVINIQTIFGR